jgi:putative membrane protein
MEQQPAKGHESTQKLMFHPPGGIVPGTHPEVISTELSSRRTGMSFQRTRMSADRTLMSVIRTSLSLITFGFTIYQTFRHLHEAEILDSGPAPARFGFALVLLGVGMLSAGIVYQLSFMRGLRRERDRMRAVGLVYAESQYPAALSLIVAILLLAIGIFSIISILFHLGPFG